MRIVPGWLVAVATVAGLALLYAAFSWVLHEQRSTVLQPYQAVEVVPAAAQSTQG
ncbi:hypothetical protein D3C78_1810350 [compost metagenome]